MTLKEQIQNDLIEAMKSKEEIRLGAIRMLKAAILKWEVDGTKKEAKDEDIVPLIKKEIKQRKDAAEQFTKGNRPELAVKEEAEMKVLEKYLPAQMDEESVKKIVKEVIAETGATSAKDFGKVMGAVMKQTQGQADGTLVSTVVKALLS